MLSFKAITEKKTNIKINPKLSDIKEADKDTNHGEDCDCMKCEKKRRKSSYGAEPEVATESAVPGKPAERLGAVTAISKDEREAAAERIRQKTAAKRKQLNKEQAYDSQEEVSEEGDQSISQEETSLLTFGQYDEGVKGAIKGAVKGAAKGAALGALGAAGVAAAGLTGGAAIPAAAAAGAITHGAYNATKGATQNDKLQALRKADQKKRDAKLLATSGKSKKESNELLSFGDFIQEARNAYAVGMAAAMKKTGDKPPLEKSTITKAHEIAKAIKKEEFDIDEERNPEVEKKGKEIAGYEKAGKYKGLVDKFRKQYPGAKRTPKKVRGAKPSEGELNQQRIHKHNARVAKHGFTKKERGESKAREKYDSARD